MHYRMLRFPARIALLFIVLALYSCEAREQPVSKEEADKMARTIESTIAKGNPEVMDNIIDIDAFAKRITASTSIKLDASMKEGLKKGLDNRRLGQEILTSIGDHGSYKLLRRYEQGGKQHLLFRLYGDQGVNYHDIELTKTGKEPKAADMLIYYTGEPLSETIGNFMNGMSETDKSHVDLDNIKRVRKLMDKGDFAAAREQYKSLPSALREKKLMLMLNVQICSALNDNAAYLDAIGEYKRFYPHATNIPLLMVDACILNKDYPKAIDAINSLDSLVGTDPFQDYYRGLVYKMAGDTALYSKYIQQLYRYDPGLQAAVLEMLNVCVIANDRSKMNEVLAVYKANKTFDQALLDR